MQAPEADVVPREECEKWYCEYHKIKDELRQEKEYHGATEKAADKYFTDLQTAKAEVAREIFEGLEKVFDDYGLEYFNSNLKRQIDEFILKYTEGTDGKQA
ncbi:MAG: hypothetical protein IJX46_07790 [Clostridia bacterium]|nr:hypothetical protein [Clostridia bacterium]